MLDRCQDFNRQQESEVSERASKQLRSGRELKAQASAETRANLEKDIIAVERISLHRSERVRCEGLFPEDFAEREVKVYLLAYFLCP